MAKRNSRSPFAALMLIGGGLLVLVAAILLITQPPPTAPPPQDLLEESVYPDIQRVSLPEAKSAYDAGSAVFLDVRAPEAYAAAHVAGAINIPLAELEARADELEQSRWIITYCT